MSAAILDTNAIALASQVGMGPPGLVLVANIATVTSTTPMKNCSELVMPAAYNLASTDDLAEQSNCEGSKKSYSEQFLPFPKHELECVGRRGGSVGFLQTKCNQPAQRFRY